MHEDSKPLSKRRGKSHPSLILSDGGTSSSSSSPSPPPSLALSLFSSAPPPPDLPAQILPFLFLGSERHTSPAILADLKISAILNVAAECDLKNIDQNIEIMHERIKDHFEEDISVHFQTCFDFIDKIKNSGGILLAHCTAGKSRSPTIIIAYLIYSLGWTLRKAYEYVQTKRKICPNIGFLCMLADFEKRTIGHQEGHLTDLCNIIPQLKILVADNEEDALTSTLQVLSKFGYEYDVARSVEDTIAKFSANTYSLVLLDLNIPGILAAQKIRELERDKENLKAQIFIMASQKDLEISEAYEIDTFLEKPIKSDVLESALRSSFGRKSPSLMK